MKKYNTPEIEIMRFEETDTIVASGVDICDYDGCPHDTAD